MIGFKRYGSLLLASLVMLLAMACCFTADTATANDTFDDITFAPREAHEVVDVYGIIFRRGRGGCGASGGCGTGSGGCGVGSQGCGVQNRNTVTAPPVPLAEVTPAKIQAPLSPVAAPRSPAVIASRPGPAQLQSATVDAPDDTIFSAVPQALFVEEQSSVEAEPQCLLPLASCRANRNPVIPLQAKNGFTYERRRLGLLGLRGVSITAQTF